MEFYRENPLKVGDLVRIVGTGSSLYDGSETWKTGVQIGEIVRITDIKFIGGAASQYDPRYCGSNFNLRRKDLDLVATLEAIESSAEKAKIIHEIKMEIFLST